MRVCICGFEIKQWHQLGLLQLLAGLGEVVSFCACGLCSAEAQPLLAKKTIPKADVLIFCSAVDGHFHAAEHINFESQLQLLDCCLAKQELVTAFSQWALHISHLSSDPVTVFTAFLLTGKTREISPSIARAVLNTCDEFHLADRVFFCKVHQYQPVVKSESGFVNAVSTLLLDQLPQLAKLG